MKKSQLILAAALVALAACNKESYDLTGPNTLNDEIGFTAVTKKATKANGDTNNQIVTGATYGTENTFQVWGWQSEKGDFSEFSANAASNFMSNLTIEWTGGRDSRTPAWRNADYYYYWPFTGKISFLAIHPSTVAPTTTGWNETVDKPKATIENYTVVGKDSTDLMFANAAGSRRADELPILFSHALSQIQFRVRTDYDYTQDSVVFKVDSVKLNNIALSGNVAYDNDVISWSANDTQTASKDYYKQTDTVHYAVNDAAAALYGRALVMIPQPANADDPDTNVLEGTTITISYTMKQKDYAAISGTVTVAAPWVKVKEGGADVDPAQPIAAWEPGKKYNYTLCFKLNEITFNPTVTDWVEVDVQTINILD